MHPGTTFSSIEIHQVLQQYWGYDAFRPQQESIIRSTLEGKDTLALMPTGGGKSLCYQVPGLSRPGTCLVISPLIALMKDQVENLRKRNITAFAIYSGMTRKEVINTLRLVTESNCKFLYVSPERLETSLFLEYLPGMAINLVAVDEAHCISQWGYDFRPAYLRIAALRKELPDVPVLALTASATPDVQQDICEKLLFKDPSIFQLSFERPNLSYSVFAVDSKINRIIEIIKKVPGTGLVYCKSRKRTREISDLLQLHKIPADYYHAGLTQEQRNARQEAWINNHTRIIACTNAFGMGIDKPDVRLVIHADVPDCLENYYQEAGRAGRDGRKAYAVLLHDGKDLTELGGMVASRFPDLGTIRTVYQAVANYLQLEAGRGAGEYFDFDINDFLPKFKLDAFTTLYALKALEQDNWVSFNEQVFVPATAQFTVTKDRLYQFELEQPELGEVLKTLLRAYEGIFDQPSFISEILVAQLLRTDVEKLVGQLRQLDSRGIIEYSPRKDKPQLFFPRARVRVEDLTINMVAYKQRKEKYLKRAKKMIDFTTEATECRSKLIGVYFGDDSINDCGICDNCLRRKATPLDTEEFERIRRQIVQLITGRRMKIRELLAQLNGIRAENAWKVIDFLQAERSITVDTEGWIET